MWTLPLALVACSLTLGGCHPCDLESVDYAPVERDDWAVSTPAEQGLDPDLVGRMYCEAARHDTLYGLLVARNGRLVAEGYFNEGSIDESDTRASVTKSYTSALVGLAIEQGCLPGVDAPMIDAFPELADEIRDPRKQAITVQQMLQMRDGYPWEETDPALWAMIQSGEYVHRLVEVPLTADPGTVHQYSNLTANWLGVMVARACGTDLRSFADEHLFAPTGTTIGGWMQDADGYYMGAFELQVTARDMARFGQLYLDEGEHEGQPVVPAEWVRDSLRSYSDSTRPLDPGPVFRDWGYGYLWWSARAGSHDVDFAWGHGGNFVFLVDDLDLVVVTTVRPIREMHSGGSWHDEKAVLNMVGRFLRSLPDD